MAPGQATTRTRVPLPQRRCFVSRVGGPRGLTQLSSEGCCKSCHKFKGCLGQQQCILAGQEARSLNSRGPWGWFLVEGLFRASLLASGGGWQPLLSLARSCITPISDPVVTWPSSLCLCVFSSYPDTCKRLPIIGFRAHLNPV